MVKIQIDLSKEENKKIGIYKIEKEFLTKAEAIKDIIRRIK